MEKDLSDSVKVHGIDKVKETLFLLLKQALWVGYMKEDLLMIAWFQKEL
jgi:hypothetical protein